MQARGNASDGTRASCMQAAAHAACRRHSTRPCAASHYLPSASMPTPPPHRRASLRLPNGCLSPMAFQPVPRSQAATPAAGTGGAAAAGGRLLLPSQELPVTFALLWEQQVDAGEGNRRKLLVWELKVFGS